MEIFVAPHNPSVTVFIKGEMVGMTVSLQRGSVMLLNGQFFIYTFNFHPNGR